MGGLRVEGIVAKRKRDPYGRGAVWWKIKNPAYSQAEGRHELFDRARRPPRPAAIPRRIGDRASSPMS